MEDEDLEVEEDGELCEIGEDIRWPSGREINSIIEYDDYSEDSFP